MAVAEASFSTSIVAMSLGLMAFSWFSTLLPPASDDGSGKPSTTYSGELLPAEVIPRTRTAVPPAPPGAPEFCVTVTPAARPCSACVGSATGWLAMSRPETEEMAPVMLPRSWVP